MSPRVVLDWRGLLGVLLGVSVVIYVMRRSNTLWILGLLIALLLEPGRDWMGVPGRYLVSVIMNPNQCITPWKWKNEKKIVWKIRISCDIWQFQVWKSNKDWKGSGSIRYANSSRHRIHGSFKLPPGHGAMHTNGFLLSAPLFSCLPRNRKDSPLFPWQKHQVLHSISADSLPKWSSHNIKRFMQALFKNSKPWLVAIFLYVVENWLIYVPNLWLTDRQIWIMNHYRKILLSTRLNADATKVVDTDFEKKNNYTYIIQYTDVYCRNLREH